MYFIGPQISPRLITGLKKSVGRSLLKTKKEANYFSTKCVLSPIPTKRTRGDTHNTVIKYLPLKVLDYNRTSTASQTSLVKFSYSQRIVTAH